MRRALLALALLTACDAPDGGVSIVVLDMQAERNLQPVYDACDFWELECDILDKYDPRGAVTIVLTDRAGRIDDDDMLAGIATHRYSCNPVIATMGRADVIAHELGHALGDFDDSDVEGNVMCDYKENKRCHFPGTHATPSQRQRVWDGANTFAACIGGEKITVD